LLFVAVFGKAGAGAAAAGKIETEAEAAAEAEALVLLFGVFKTGICVSSPFLFPVLFRICFFLFLLWLLPFAPEAESCAETEAAPAPAPAL
tara:strand:+ start:123 stop:395 length:273 start_codon:yes stop_codon:yes gene_type:complete